MVSGQNINSNTGDYGWSRALKVGLCWSLGRGQVELKGICWSRMEIDLCGCGWVIRCHVPATKCTVAWIECDLLVELRNKVCRRCRGGKVIKEGV